MKSFKSLMESLAEAWPGTPEYKKKFGSSDDGSSGSRHSIERSAGITRATRKYDADSGESEEPTKNREDAAAAPVKRGRGRPPGKYGSYKKKVKESLEIMESLDTDEEIEEFIYSLDEESFEELAAYLSEKVEDVVEGSGSKEKQKTPYRDINSPEYRAAAEKQKQQMAKDKAAEPGKKLADKIAKKGVAEEVDQAEVAEGQLRNFSPHSDLAGRGRLSGYNKTAAGKKREYDRETERLKGKMKFTKSQGGIAGPKGKLPEEVELDEKYMGAEKLASSLAAKGAKDPKALAAWIGRKKYGKEAFQKAAAKGEKMSEDANLDEVDEALKHPNHKVLDKNGNNKLDKEDFKILRGEKKAPVKEEVSEEKVADLAAFITKQSKGEA